MPLIKCPECGNSVSDRAESCPKCAYPIAGSGAAATQVHAGTIQTIEQTAKHRKHRLWLALLVVAALIAAPFAPKFPLWLGIIPLVLCIGAFIRAGADLLNLSERLDTTTTVGKTVSRMIAVLPLIQDLSRRLLRLDPSEKWRSGLRLAVYGLIGLVLIVAGGTGASYKAERERIATKEAAEEAERQRLAKEANRQVVALARQAETAWTAGNVTLAQKKLDAASKTPNATELAPIRRLRTRMANAKVEALMAAATEALNTGDIEAGRQKAQDALAVSHADALAEASKLHQQIGNGTDPTRIRTTLMELSDDAFQKLQEGGDMPKQLVSGYEGLDSRTADLAKAQLADVAVAREQRHQAELAAQKKREEEQRLVAERARSAEERRRAEAKRQQEERERHMTPLIVENWRWHIEHGFAIGEGEVTNRSDRRLENVQVVVSFYTKDNQFITTADAIVEYNPILPRQTTPFKAYATHNPQMNSARLAFKHLFGGSIGYKKR